MLENINFLLAPLCIGAILVITHVTFGQEVLKRGIIFIDLTLAQVAACGIIIGSLIGLESSWWALQLLATATAVAVALALAGIEKLLKGKHQEAIIGAVYAVSASLVLILIANDNHAQTHSQELLNGQLLWLGFDTLHYALPLYALLLSIWWLAVRYQFSRWVFYPLLAILVTSSIQLIGLYLVFATLILPALAVVGLRHSLLLGWILGICGYTFGLLASNYSDWPTDPMIVVMLGLLAAAAALLRGSIHGIRKYLYKH